MIMGDLYPIGAQGQETAKNARVHLIRARRALIVTIVALGASYCVYGQSTANTYPVPKAILNQMIYEVNLGRQCDTLARFQSEVIRVGLQVAMTQDSLIDVQTSQIGNLGYQVETWEKRYANQVEVTRIEKKEVRKWKFLTFTAVGFFVLSLIFKP